MKRILTLLVALIGLTGAWATDVVVDTITYELDENTHTACVKDGKSRSGDVVVPKIVKDNGVSYRVTKIGDNAFEDCTAMTSIVLPAGLTEIGDWAFSNCYALASIIIPEGVTTIGDNAFLYCERLTSITLPETLMTIGDGAFCACFALTSIVIPEGVTSLGEKAFQDCSSLTSAVLPSTLTEIGGWTFITCPELTSVTLPEGLTRIGYAAFCACTSLPSVTLPNSLTVIDKCAFEICLALTSITIPGNVTTIDQEAFDGCTGLKTVTFLNSVASVDGSAFNDCDSISSVYAISPVPLSIVANTFPSAPNATLYVPMSCKAAYEAATGWDEFGNIVELGWGENSTVLEGDMNHDGALSIADVTLLVDRILGREPQTPDPHESVDLDLPSGTLWATCNVGADNPEESGDYFAWGETVPYLQEDTSNTHNYNTTGSYQRISYNWSTYKWCDGTTSKSLTKYCMSANYGSNGFTDNLNELEPEDDAATANWGSRWQTPSLEQFEELIDSNNTTIEYTEQNGVSGYEITSITNGNSIFLPDAEGTPGISGAFYWSRSISGNGPNASYLKKDSGTLVTSALYRHVGYPIRPVRANRP